MSSVTMSPATWPVPYVTSNALFVSVNDEDVWVPRNVCVPWKAGRVSQSPLVPLSQKRRE